MKRLSWKVWLRDGGIAVGFFLVFLYLTFPWAAVTERVEGELATAMSTPQAPAHVSIDSVHSNWVTGVVLDHVMLTRPDPDGNTGQAALVPELKVRFGLLAFLRGDQSISFSAQTAGGEVTGELTDSKKLSTLDVEAKGVQLGQAKDLIGFFAGADGMDLNAIDLTGVADLKADLSFKPNEFFSVKGKVSAAVEHALVNGGTVGELDLPKVDLGRLDLAAHAESGKLDVDRFKIDGGDATVESDGLFLTLNQNLILSIPHGKLRVRVGEELQKRVPYLGMGLSALKQPDREGFYVFALSGTLKKPNFL